MTRLGTKNLTYKVNLAGGQDRLREMILYVSEHSKNSPRWGKTKLNKTLWRADFESFLTRGIPVTGRAYQRLPRGPAPVEMAPVLGEMISAGLVSIEYLPLQSGLVEERIIPNAKPNLRFFSQDDLRFVDQAINYLWDDSATDVSRDSHGIAWQSRVDGDPMPYELAYISDRRLSIDLERKLKEIGAERGWKSE